MYIIHRLFSVNTILINIIKMPWGNSFIRNNLLIKKSIYYTYYDLFYTCNKFGFHNVYEKYTIVN